MHLLSFLDFHRNPNLNLISTLTQPHLSIGSTGVVALGMFLLGATVAIGVLKGELDPNNAKPKETKVEDNTTVNYPSITKMDMDNKL